VESDGEEERRSLIGRLSLPLWGGEGAILRRPGGGLELTASDGYGSMTFVNVVDSVPRCLFTCLYWRDGVADAVQ
jgi:hypothetical protein